MIDPKEIALTNTILRGVVGSTAHGTGLEGHEDRDEMGIFVEPPENVMGLSPIEHMIQRDQHYWRFGRGRSLSLWLSV